MIKIELKIVLLWLTLALTVVILGQASAWGQAKATPPPTEWGGTYCAEKRPMVLVIRNRNQLTHFLGRELGPKGPIDFQKNAVVGVFMGQKMTGGYGVEFQEPYVQDSKLIVPFQEQAPGPGRFVTQALTTPCRFKVVPVKPDQEVVLKNLLDVSKLAYRPIIYRPAVFLDLGRFKFEIPMDWYWEEDQYRTYPQGTAGGLTILAPAELEGEGVKFFVDHYSSKAGAPLENPQTYVENYPPDDVRFSYLKEKFQAGRPPASDLSGQWFERQATVTLRDGTNKELMIKELLGVIPAANGFYALHYWAPAVLFDKYAPVFQRLAKSFQPLP